MKLARSKRPYNVIRLSWRDFVDLKAVQKNEASNMDKMSNGSRLNWMKIKAVKFDTNNSGMMLFTYSHGEEYQVVSIKGRIRGRPSASNGWPALYDSALPIKKAKKDDLVSLCNNNLIPIEYQDWFKSLDFIGGAEEGDDDDEDLSDSD
uniref:Uncharacterized protein n=1 Tax=Romanomermis culicivorax TaxID=13658 RepID=A0A915J6G9_ROMCU